MDVLPRTLSHREVTENGRASLGSPGNAVLAAYFKLVRGLSEAQRRMHVSAMLAQGRNTENPDAVVDAVVLWAQTRDVRGGKGERALGNGVLLDLAGSFPATVEALLPLMVEYGSWKDVFQLWTVAEARGEEMRWLRDALMDMAVAQLRTDFASEHPSLASKWAPREKCKDKEKKALAKALARELFGDAKDPRGEYRRALARAGEVLGTTETKMCAGEWSDIAPSSVPACCMCKYRRALLNLKGPNSSEPRSEEEDRVGCARNFEEHLKSSKKIHGRDLHPHQLAKPYFDALVLKNPRASDECTEDPILEAQWQDLRRDALAKLEEAAVDTEGPPCTWVPLVDVSGSMYENKGLPLMVAISMGILLSEVARPEFRDRFLTFSRDTEWHRLDPKASLLQKMRSAKSAKWGGSTNLSKAFRLILDACREGAVPPEDVAKLVLVVFSDMQFDAPSTRGPGCGPWATQYEEIVGMFNDAGYPGVPHVVFWNLRGNTRDYPAKDDTPGVTMLSGFSPSQLKFLIAADLETMATPTEAPKSRPDPLDAMRKVLDDQRYDPVREVCARVGEGAMAGYEVPLRPTEAGATEAEA